MNTRKGVTVSEDAPTTTTGKVYPDIVENPLDEISSTSYVLGIFFGVAIALLPNATFWNFNVYIAALCTFHFLEFYITARYNPGKVHVDSFVIKNGLDYFLAHAFSISEVCLELWLCPNWKNTWHSTVHTACVMVGIVLLFFGQYVRSQAMVTAGRSFSHLLKTVKESDHELVTNGIYRISRHPSYFGYFWWALGMQLVLLNPVTFVLFAVILWNYFRNRIQKEEKYLLQFFGSAYATYKKNTGVYIPFIA
ncbi:AaceriAAR122Cp [[Ashbya] aceris (nom. inval.)]|nr:AaceriAAR122Cp [[Ashbya] aceris (nom. inval.)]